MTDASDLAEHESALAIVAECKALVTQAIHAEEQRDPSDAERLAGLQIVLVQLRDEKHAIQRDDRAVITRARLLYGLLLKQARSIVLA
jgi:hypothetical protein